MQPNAQPGADPLQSTPAVALGVLLFLLLFQLSFFGLPALVWAWIGRQNLKEAFFLTRRPNRNEIVGGALVGLAMVPVATALLFAQNAVVPMDREAAARQFAMFAAQLEHWWFLAVPLISLAAATTEEVFFRGVLHRALAKRMATWVAVGVGAVLFAGLHLDLQGMIVRTLLGVLFGVMVVRGRSLWAPLTAHFVYDAVLLGAGAWQIRQAGGADALKAAILEQGPLMGTTGSDVALGLAWGLPCLLAGGILLAATYRRYRREPGTAADSPPEEEAVTPARRAA